MCLSKAYLDRNGGRELVIEEVASVSVEKGRLRFKTLFGEERELVASIREVDFVANRILLQEVKA